ncbi:zinc finger (C3HC4-type RING finger) family protein [Actinidia rufa]|uniref:Zinc finger (C3HC4-type RING finger) family protein n=1 Tax=Actinidia rufa TaxID=165716 RepID=A0A7J0GMT3_9ERIC|nr:zinc finger (C3HC4-type RING finger) family protein [Actinidia rufa]
MLRAASLTATGSESEGLEDVEEFVGVNEGESSMSAERFRHVSDLMQIGNQAFRENRFEEAINCYSRANTVNPGDPAILSNRCAAYLRSPSASEHIPLSGLDPTIHAELALKDAEKVMNFQGDLAKSYILKANALILLEKYELARDVILSGLQIDPTSNPLKVLERTTACTIGSRDHGKPERTDDFDCTVCLKLLYEPITTPCGHTFCRSCLFQSMDRGNRCPLCRTVLFISPRTCATSVTLNSIIQKNFPEEYAERKLENDSLTNLGGDLMPLFVMDVVLPCQKFQLNIFEPRYRLMLESRRRFRILRNWDQDGYRVAEIEWVRDISQSEETRERGLQEMIGNAAGFARSWLRTAREAAQQRQDSIKLLELDKAESMMPTTRDPELFSFWLATLTKADAIRKIGTPLHERYK